MRPAAGRQLDFLPRKEGKLQQTTILQPDEFRVENVLQKSRSVELPAVCRSGGRLIG